MGVGWFYENLFLIPSLTSLRHESKWDWDAAVQNMRQQNLLKPFHHTPLPALQQVIGVELAREKIGSAADNVLDARSSSINAASAIQLGRQGNSCRELGTGHARGLSNCCATFLLSLLVVMYIFTIL